MDGYVQLDEISRDILKEIGNVGTGNAVTSLSQMMEQPIELDMPSLKVVKYYKMHELLEQPVYAERSLYQDRNKYHFGGGGTEPYVSG